MTRIDRNDWIRNIKIDELEADEFIPHSDERPMTATKKFTDNDIHNMKNHLKKNQVPDFTEERPETSAIIKNDPYVFGSDNRDNEVDQFNRTRDQYNDINMSNSIKKKRSKIDAIKVTEIEINILDTWGDIFYVGLNGIEVLDKHFEPINLKEDQLDAKPRDMNSIPGYSGDHRVLENLVNGENSSSKDQDIWLIPYTAGEDHTVRILFSRPTEIKGIKFYNYNKSEEDSLRGARTVLIKGDGKLLTPRRGVVIKKASGKVIPGYDFSYFVTLPYSDGWTNKQIIPIKSHKNPPDTVVAQEYETLPYPIGFVMKFNLYSTHGDFHYIGLNGIEIFDQNGI
jgi:hypothetical protein